MVGWHHRFNGDEFEQTLGDSEGQGSLVYCSPWGHKELDTTEQLTERKRRLYLDYTYRMCVCMLVAQSCLTLFFFYFFFIFKLDIIVLVLPTPWTIACQAPLSMGFPRQEYWSG